MTSRNEFAARRKTPGADPPRSVCADEPVGGRDIHHLMTLALRILRSRADAWAVLSSVRERVRSAKLSPSAPRLEDVVRECLAVIDRRAVSGHRFGLREIRRYQREVTLNIPDRDAEVEVALSMLPDRARTVLILHDLEMLRLDEIADVLDVSSTAARSYLHRARAAIRLYLQVTPAAP